MRKWLVVIVLMLCVSLSLPVWAAKEGHKDGSKGKGPSDRAYERANENAAFKRDENWEPGKKRKKHGEDDQHHKRGKNHKKDRKHHEHEGDGHHNDHDDDHDENSNEQHSSDHDDVLDDAIKNQTGD